MTTIAYFRRGFTDITIDFVEGLQRSSGKTVIMVVMDSFTKYGHFIGLSHPYLAHLVTQVLLDSVYKLHGLSNTITSDNDAIFISGFWCKLFKFQGLDLKLSFGYHP